MVTEEIGLNDFLEENGITPVETDLGEYIIQLAHEPPSHIIGPALHKTREQVAELFEDHHPDYAPHGVKLGARSSDPQALVSEARSVRSEEHTSELQSLMRISYAVFCLKKKNQITQPQARRHKLLTHQHL